MTTLAPDCQCTRCRHQHVEALRPWSPTNRLGLRHSLCPKCGGKTVVRLPA